MALKQLNVDGEVGASGMPISVWIDFQSPGLPIHYQGLAEQNGFSSPMFAVLGNFEHLEDFKRRKNVDVDVQFNLLEINLEASQTLLETRRRECGNGEAEGIAKVNQTREIAHLFQRFCVVIAVDDERALHILIKRCLV